MHDHHFIGDFADRRDVGAEYNKEAEDQDAEDEKMTDSQGQEVIADKLQEAFLALRGKGISEKNKKSSKDDGKAKR